MSYGGESNAKRLARAKFWNHVWQMRWKEGKNLNDRVLVLAGPEAADVRCLRAVGIDPAQVTAVDVSGESIESSRAIVPEANYVVDDVFDYVKKEGRRRFDVMFFDFCKPLSPHLVHRVMQVINVGQRQKEGFAGVGSMYGRENQDYRQQAKGVIDDKALEEEASTSPLPPAAIARADFFYYEFGLFLKRSRLCLFPSVFITYRSGRRVGNRSCGTPMLYTGFRVRKNKRIRAGEMLLRAMHNYRRECEQEDDHYLEEAVGDDPDGEKLQEEALMWRRGGNSSERVADFLNLRRQQVAAWLAWDTMRSQQQAST